jgi:lipopolysaccharide export LptBFGC system permease protein LptF
MLTLVFLAFLALFIVPIVVVKLAFKLILLPFRLVGSVLGLVFGLLAGVFGLVVGVVGLVLAVLVGGVALLAIPLLPIVAFFGGIYLIIRALRPRPAMVRA